MSTKNEITRSDKTSRSWDEVILPMLREDPGYAMDYLRQCLEDENPNVFLLALADVISAYGGFSAFARLAGLNRTNLHRALSEDGNPTWNNLSPILRTLGIEFTLNSKKTSFLRSSEKTKIKPSVRSTSAKRKSVKQVVTS